MLRITLVLGTTAIQIGPPFFCVHLCLVCNQPLCVYVVFVRWSSPVFQLRYQFMLLYFWSWSMLTIGLLQCVLATSWLASH